MKNTETELRLSLNKVKDILLENKLLIECNINDESIDYISCDSRDIKDNTLFLCKGAYFKEEYLKSAIKMGATAYVAEQNYKIDGTPCFVVNNILKAMGLISLEFYNHPDKKFTKVGITGTKGKTTVNYLLNNILKEYVKGEVGLISSIELNTGLRKEESHITTPEAIEMQKYFYEMGQAKLKYATVEVSSQSYKRYRLEGVEFDYGMFLNIDKDHISKMEHPSFEDYFQCKLEFLKHCQNVLVNINTKHLDEVIASVKDKNIIFYGTDSKADFYVEEINKKADGFTFIVKNDKLQYSTAFKLKMPGRFNIENAVAAIAVAKLLGVDDKSIQRGLLKTKVPGRMNILEEEGRTVVIDYAHNKLSFEELYKSLKKDYPNRRIISVGGAVGGKAYNRREAFGQVVGKESDYIYLTADDPQFEEVRDICEEIGKYIEDKSKYEIIEDRKKAIEKAFKNSKDGDIIVLLSKGTDKYQRIKNVDVPYESDPKIAKKNLKMLRV